MKIEGIVNRIYHNPAKEIVMVMLQGSTTVHEFATSRKTEQQVGLTKAGDLLAVETIDDCLGGATPILKWTNCTLNVDLGG